MKCDCGHEEDHHNPGDMGTPESGFSGNCRNCSCLMYTREALTRESREKLLEQLERSGLSEGESVAADVYMYKALEVAKVVKEKNEAYGSAFAKAGEFLKLLYPDGIQPEQYKDALLLVRIFDKQMRIATDKDALGENPYQDIQGYGLLGCLEDEG